MRKKAYLILLIDFRKAFDSIDHKFITTVLKELGFGDDIIKWISIFFDSREAGRRNITLHIYHGSGNPTN